MCRVNPYAKKQFCSYRLYSQNKWMWNSRCSILQYLCIIISQAHTLNINETISLRYFHCLITSIKYRPIWIFLIVWDLVQRIYLLAYETPSSPNHCNYVQTRVFVYKKPTDLPQKNNIWQSNNWSFVVTQVQPHDLCSCCSPTRSPFKWWRINIRTDLLSRKIGVTACSGEPE
jgi:hypothetical protein